MKMKRRNARQFLLDQNRKKELRTANVIKEDCQRTSAVRVDCSIDCKSVEREEVHERIMMVIITITWDE